MGANFEGWSALSLAHKFVDATIDQWGVNREQVEAVLAEVARRGIKDEFASQLWSFRLHKDTGETYDKLLKKYGDALVPSILKDELSGSGLQKALALWHGGPVVHAQGWAARIQGMKDALNALPTFGHKEVLPFVDKHPVASWAILTGAGVGLYYGGSAIAAASPYVTGGFLLFEGAKVGKNEIDAATTHDPGKKEKSLEKSGEGIANIGMIVVTEGAAKGAKAALRAGTAEAEAFPLVTRRMKTLPEAVPADTAPGLPAFEASVSGTPTIVEPMTARRAIKLASEMPSVSTPVPALSAARAREPLSALSLRMQRFALMPGEGEFATILGDLQTMRANYLRGGFKAEAADVCRMGIDFMKKAMPSLNPADQASSKAMIAELEAWIAFLKP